jgi:threonine dehydratase
LVNCFERVKLVTEPSGASALAALMTGKVDGRDKTVEVTISGEYRAGRLLPDRQPA